MEGPSTFSNPLPMEVVQDILDRLPPKNKGRCSQVCRQWEYAFHSKYAWQSFTFKDEVFVRYKFTQHSGWQYHIDHWRLKSLITNTLQHWRTLIVEPVTNLFNLHEFFRVLANYAEHYDTHSETFKPTKNINTFNFKWRLHVEEDAAAGVVEDKDVGTGGQMLQSLQRVLNILHGLTSLTLTDLQLSNDEADEFMLTLLEKFQEKLTYLSLLNYTIHPKPFIQVGCFLSLKKLLVSPQMLCTDTLLVIACLEHLETFSIVQDEKSSQSPDISRNAWNMFTEQNMGRTQIWLILRGKPQDPLIIQPGAPVYGIKMEQSAGQLTMEIAEQITNYYGNTLRHFIQLGWERMKRGNKMDDRVDSAIVEIASRCRHMERIACREKMSYATAIILSVFASRTGYQLWIRKNALLKRVCWCRRDIEALQISWEWLRDNSKFYKLTFGIIEYNTAHRSILDDKAYRDLKV